MSPRRRVCPKCRFDEDADATSCRQCGIVFEKYDPLRGHGPAAGANNAGLRPGRIGGSSGPPRSRNINLGPILLLMAIAGFAAWFLLDKPYEVVGAEPESGGPVVIFMHGYGAPGDDLVRAATSISSSAPEASFIVLEAPHGKVFGRAWAVGGTRQEMMEQVAESRQRIFETIDEMVAKGVAPSDIYVGGFSQGGQMALDVGFGKETGYELGGLIMLSGGYPNWPESVTPGSLGASRLGPGARVLVAHGRNDSVVSFVNGERVREDVSGYVPTRWVPFDGGHTISPEVEVAVAQFLADH